MITRPVAVVRALVVVAVVWGIGAAVVVGLFQATDASATIDVDGIENRVQLVWLGAHAFVACIAALLGVVAGASALTGAGGASARAATLVVAPPLLVLAALTLVVLASTGSLSAAMAIAELVGLGIGASAGAIFATHATPDEDTDYGAWRSPNAGTRGWSSR